MKKFFLLPARAIALAGLMIWASACDDDDKPNPQNQIVKTWSIGGSGFVKQDGVDVTSDYQNLTFTIKSDGTYSTANAGKLFFPSGTWAWQGTGTTAFVIDGDFEVTVNELNASTLHVEFDMAVDDVNANGRTKAIVGSYEVKLEGN